MEGVKGVENELLLDAMRVASLGITSGFAILTRLVILPNGPGRFVGGFHEVPKTDPRV